MSNQYSLRLYNMELMRFTMEERGLEGLVAEILNVNDGAGRLMPLDMPHTGEGVFRWLQRRVMGRYTLKSHRKACLAILFITLFSISLVGCKPRTEGIAASSEVSSDESVSQPQEESEDQEEQLAQEIFHPFDWLRWNNRGGKLEVFDGYTLYQIDLNNDRTEVVTLQVSPSRKNRHEKA